LSSPPVLTHDGEDFRDLETVIRYIQFFSNSEQRYQLLEHFRDQFLRVQQSIESAVERFEAFATQDFAYLEHGHENADDWASIQQFAAEVRTKQNRIAAARRTIAERWGERIASSIVPDDMAYSTLENIRKAALLIPSFQVAQRTMNQCMVDRIGQRRKGITTKAEPQSVDWRRVSENRYPKGICKALNSSLIKNLD
jgi:hypothetical protein